MLATTNSYITIIESWRFKMYDKKNVILFPGYGIYQKKMMSILSQASPYLEKRISEIDKTVSEIYHVSLLDDDNEDDIIKSIRVFSSEVVITELWEKSGLKIDYLIGHSMGEYAAAVISGIMSIKDAIFLLKERSICYHENEPHCTAFSESTADEILNIADEYGFSIYIISYNTPDSVTVCGMTDEINHLVKICRNKHIRFGVINKFHGAHYPGLKEYADNFNNSIQKIKFQRPEKNIISTVYPEKQGNLIFDSDYWTEHIYKPVKFSQAIKKIPADTGLILDVGISPVLLDMAKHNLSETNDTALFVPSIKLGRNYKQQLENAMDIIADSGININKNLLA